MNNKQALAAIKMKVRLMYEVNRLGHQIDRWFEERYGKSYSEIDCDTLIDSLDYGRGPPPATLEQIDLLMKQGF